MCAWNIEMVALVVGGRGNGVAKEGRSFSGAIRVLGDRMRRRK